MRQAQLRPAGAFVGWQYSLEIRAVIMTSILLQEEQSLCFLQALGNIHLGQPRITFPSPVRVAGVGR